MHKLPKLRVQSFFETDCETDIYDFEQAKDRIDYETESIILVEGQSVNSHDELVQLATKEQYKDKEFLEVVVLPYIVGG